MQRRKKSPLENDMESVALGTLLTGMRKLYWDTEQFMRTRIEEVEHRYRQLVGSAKVAARHELDGENNEEQPLVKRRGRPRKNFNLGVAQMSKITRGARPGAKGGSLGWSTDPAERSREMKRRMSVARMKREAKEGVVVRLQGRRQGATRIHDPEKWLKNVRRSAKKRWENMSAAQRKARLAAMHAGRARQRVNGQLNEAGA